MVALSVQYDISLHHNRSLYAPHRSFLGACAIATAAALVQACSGASATSPLPASGGAADGYPTANTITRDVSGASGGQKGFVNAAQVIHTITGQLETAFEWAGVAILDNYAQEGENVATYSQANKLNTGPTWAGVSEATDTTGGLGALISHEFDNFVTGPDNGNRIGLDVLNGDAHAVRNQGRSALAESSVGVRVGQSTVSPYASWGVGLQVQGNVRDAAIRVKDASGNVVFEVRPDGSVWTQGRKL